MAVSLKCPHCQKELKLTVAHASRPVICRACGKTVRAPRPNPHGEYFLLTGAQPSAAPSGSAPLAAPPKAAATHARQNRPEADSELARPAANQLPAVPWRQLAPLIGLIAFLLLALLGIWIYTAVAD